MNPTENPKTLMLLSGGMNSAALILHLTRKLQRPVVEAMIFDRLTPSGSETAYAKRTAARAGVGFSTWQLHTAPMIGMDVELMPDDFRVLDDTQAARAQMLVKATFRAREMRCEKIASGFLAEELNMLVDDLYLFTGAAATFAGLSASAFEFPFMKFTKADVFELARQEDILVEVGFHTMSCLTGDDETKHQWGYGCGSCSGCERRAAGWAMYIEGLNR